MSNVWLNLNECVTDLISTSTEEIYWFYVSQMKSPLMSVGKWQLDFGINSEMWPDIFRLSFKTVRETKIQSFQYRVLSRVLPCNYWLHKLRIKQNNLCDFCRSVDTIEHFLVSCPANRSFWNELEIWLKKTNIIPENDSVSFNSVNIIFGFLQLEYGSKIINLIILYAKYYIYIERLQGKNVTVKLFQNVLREKLHIEKYITIKMKKLYKWKPYENLYKIIR